MHPDVAVVARAAAVVVRAAAVVAGTADTTAATKMIAALSATTNVALSAATNAAHAAVTKAELVAMTNAGLGAAAIALVTDGRGRKIIPSVTLGDQMRARTEVGSNGDVGIAEEL